MGLGLGFEEKGLTFELAEFAKGFEGFAPDSDVNLVAKRLSPRPCCGVACSAVDSATDFVTLECLLSFVF